ncbi:MAG: hypothetical protein PHV35_10770 [Mariniphaga sp.]|nr:hypothetical protein [Mariniphaga sp.]
MKNFVKQILTVLFSILVFFIASAQENTNESAELIASATVQGALSITKDAMSVLEISQLLPMELSALYQTDPHLPMSVATQLQEN